MTSDLTSATVPGPATEAPGADVEAFDPVTATTDGDTVTTDADTVTTGAAADHPSTAAVTNSGVTPPTAHVAPPPVQSARAKAIERTVGVLALVGTGFTVWLGLWVTPPDKVQGDLVRLVYIHPGVAWVALYLAFGLAAVSSLLYLWPRTRSLFWDRLAAAAVEVGVIYNICTLVSGSIWGKPTWGVWWAWDARLTLTAVLLVLFLGYLALRRIPAEPEVRARRSAFVALFAALDVPLVHFSVDWWNTLHQGATVLNPGLSLKIHGSMAWTLLLGFVALTLAFVWMLLVRYRIGVLEDWLDANELDMALAERQSEGGGPVGGLAGAPTRGPAADRVGAA
jgi:heme exporter protein C